MMSYEPHALSMVIPETHLPTIETCLQQLSVAHNEAIDYHDIIYICKDFVYYSLKYGWGVTEAKIHHQQFIHAPLKHIKVAFHSSPSLIHTLLYPHLRSTLVNSLASLSLSMSWEISGNG